jgi:hypothetical protein
MNVRHLIPSVSRWFLYMGFLMLAAGLQQPVHASSVHPRRTDLPYSMYPSKF